MKPLTPAQQRVVDVMKRIAFVIFYALWFIPGIALLILSFFSGMLLMLLAWIITGKTYEDRIDYIIFAPLVFPYWLFGYN